MSILVSVSDGMVFWAWGMERWVLDRVWGVLEGEVSCFGEMGCDSGRGGAEAGEHGWAYAPSSFVITIRVVPVSAEVGVSSFLGLALIYITDSVFFVSYRVRFI